MDAERVLENVRALAQRFREERAERQVRQELDAGDFAALADAGFLLTGVPVEDGGLWESVAASTRPIGEILRALARGDSSVALVSSMHPAVLAFWLATPEAPEPHTDAWAQQRSDVVAVAQRGGFWGTITSEPGSGGDIANTRARAEQGGDGAWTLTGEKHFGSGSGVTSRMITTAVPDGEEEPDWFFLDTEGVPWDGSRGVTLLAPWDGQGMKATQSHSMRFDGAAVTRVAWPGNWRPIAEAAMPCIGALFTAVILGVVDEALDSARRDLGKRKDDLNAFEQVEWVEAEREAWLAEKAYEGMLATIETSPLPHRAVLMGKTSVAELAESVTRRIGRVLGGGTFARRSPYGHWFEDVRALGFLRPPWSLAVETLVQTAFLEGD